MKQIAITHYVAMGLPVVIAGFFALSVWQCPLAELDFLPDFTLSERSNLFGARLQRALNRSSKKSKTPTVGQVQIAYVTETREEFVGANPVGETPRGSSEASVDGKTSETRAEAATSADVESH